MMTRVITYAMPFIFLLSGCTTSELDRFNERMAVYQRMVSTPTPDTWQLGDEWVFIVMGKSTEVRQTINLRFTDRPAVSCMSGDWKEVEVLGTDYDPDGVYGNYLPGVFENDLAYELEGSRLTFGRVSVCDNYFEVSGELIDSSFAGEIIATGLFYYEEFGRVYGARALSGIVDESQTEDPLND